MSHTYRTLCRFNRDSDLVSTIRWYEADPRAADYDGWQAIGSTYWDINDGYQSPVGELIDAPKITTLQRAWPGAFGQHICGTAEDFEKGGLYLPTPPVIYTISGLPVCCDPARVGAGGVGWGGKSTVERESVDALSGGGEGGGSVGDVQVLVDALSGGGEGGGSVGDVQVLVDALSGGGEGGGSVGDVFTPGGPGPTCLTALVMTSGVPYVGSIGPTDQQWFMFPASGSSSTAEVAQVQLTGGTLFGNLSYGTCASPTTVGTLVATVTNNYTHSGSRDYLLQMTTTGAATYSITFTDL